MLTDGYAAALICAAPLAALALGASHGAAVQVRPDTTYAWAIEEPAFAEGAGPVVAIDEGHFNYHTLEGRYAPFASLLRQDGFRVTKHEGRLTSESLAAIDVLVIANARHHRNRDRGPDTDRTYPHPSAFTMEEVEAAYRWVEEGGALLLIADHAPNPGAVRDLADRFGVHFFDVYVFDETRSSADGRGLPFTLADGTLHDHPVVRGRNETEAVKEVTTFTGSGFVIRFVSRTEQILSPILAFSDSARALIPQTADFPAAGWYQGAAGTVGSGRVAVFGEAAMFTAQVTGDGRIFGMRQPGAEQNPQLVLNLVRWLVGLIPEE